MATPEAEETVAPPATGEAAVAEVVKTAESEKEVPKTEEIPVVTEEKSVEATPAETPAEETTEATPPEPFKEESNLVADLKESEKKALEEFKARIVKAIEDNEFKVPKKVVEPPKEPEVVETPKEVPAEAPATETPATEEKVEEIPAAETPATEAPPPAAEPPVEEEKPVPPPEPTPEAPEPVVEPTPEAPEPVVEPEPAAPIETTPKEAPLLDETAVVEESKEAAPVEETPAVVEEEEEDTTPPEDVALWGVPLLHTKGDERTHVILLKFLRARDFNVAQAFDMLKKTVIWRKTYKVESLLDEEFDTDFDKVAYNYGKDKEGHPVCYNVYSPFQNKELYTKAFGDSAKLANFLRWRIQVLEKGIKLLNFTPEGPTAMVQITDCKNIPGPFSKKDMRSAYNQAVNLLQDNYPELVVKKVFINVPWYFNVVSAFYALVSMNPFISARTKSKFVVYAPAKTTEGLLKFISAEDVPVAYGGLSKAGDTEFVGVEAPVTEKVLKAGEKATIEIPISESSGSVLWDLAVTGYEVSYGAEFVPSAEGSYTTIIEKPKKLASTTEEPVRTSFKFSEPGKIIISIDNSSRKKKTALYRYTIKPNTSETELAG